MTICHYLTRYPASHKWSWRQHLGFCLLCFPGSRCWSVLESYRVKLACMQTCWFESWQNLLRWDRFLLKLRVAKNDTLFNSFHFSKATLHFAIGACIRSILQHRITLFYSPVWFCYKTSCANHSYISSISQEVWSAHISYLELQKNAPSNLFIIWVQCLWEKHLILS